MNRTFVEMKMLRDAMDKLRQLETENIRLRSALVEIGNLCQLTGMSFEDQSFTATRLVQEALQPK